MMNINDVMVTLPDFKPVEEMVSWAFAKKPLLRMREFVILEKWFCVDVDCCFWEVENKFFEGKILQVANIDCRVQKVMENGSIQTSMFPDFSVDVPVDRLIKSGKKLTLVEYIRYNYNPRIISNQRLLMKHLEKMIKEGG